MNWEQLLGWTLVHSVWELASIGVAAFLVLLSLRKASASVRYLLAAVALLSCALIPFATGIFLYLDDKPLQVATAVSPSPAARPTAAFSVDGPSISPPTTTLGEELQNRLPILVRVWLFGLCVMSLRMFGAIALVRRVRARSTQAGTTLRDRCAVLTSEMGVRGKIELRISRTLESPCVVGALKSVVLFPASALSRLSTGQIEALLAHEIAHVRRHDYLANLIQSFVETILFYHPAVWWLSHVVRVEREHCCDDLAIRAIGERTIYANALASLEQLRPPTLAVAGNGGDLLNRIRRIAGMSRPNRFSPASVLALLVVLTLITVALAHSPTSGRQPLQGEGIVVGQVVTQDGRPAGGALVECTGGNPNTLQVYDNTAVTDRNGRFSVRGNLGPNDQVFVALPGVGIGGTLARVQQQSVRVALAKASPVTVQVIDDAGRAMPGVSIAPSSVNGGIQARFRKILSTLGQVTDSKGRTTFSYLPERAWVTFETTDERLAVEPQAQLTNGEVQPLQVKVGPACSLIGHLTLNGKPFGTASASCWCTTGLKNDLSLVDSTGEFHFNHFPAGPVGVDAYLPKALRKEWVIRPVSTNLLPGRVNHVELRLERGGLIRGKAIDFEGNPIVKPSIIIMNSRPAVGFGVTDTRDDGTFEGRVPSGSYRVSLSVNGGLASKRVEVKDGQTSNIALQPSGPAYSVFCRVMDADGRYVPNFTIFAKYKAGRDLVGNPVETNGAGLAHAYVPRNARVTFEAHMGNQFSTPVEAWPGQTATLRMRRVELGRIRGRVLDGNGAPVLQAEVRLRLTGDLPVGDFQFGRYERVTNTLGQYSIQGLYPGNSVSLMIRALNHSDFESNTYRTSGKTTSIADIHLAPGGTISGRVVDQNGRPILNAQVIMENVPRVRDTVIRTDPDGRFKIDYLPLGTHRLGIWKGYKEMHYKVATNSDRTYVLRL